jgi:hypothetical protein
MVKKQTAKVAKKETEIESIPQVKIWVNVDGTIEWKGEGIDAKTVIMFGAILTNDGMRLMEELPTVTKKVAKK